MESQLRNLQDRKHIPGLDGLRGVAVLFVITYHYSSSFHYVFAWGRSSVDLFFVLSGFLMTGLLTDSLPRKDYFSHFYRNRILRIFPLYYLALIVFFTALLLSGNEHEKPLYFYRHYGWSYLIFVQNWTHLFFGVPVDKTLVHFWSLAVEIQFYIMWPFLIYEVRNMKKLQAILLSIIVLALVFRIFVYFHSSGSYDQVVRIYNSFCRLDCFAAGALISLIGRVSSKIKTKSFIFLCWLSILLILAGMFATNNFTLKSSFFVLFGYSLVAIFYASIVYLSLGGRCKFLDQVLQNRQLLFCGKISYGLYIFHWPIRLIAGSRLNAWSQSLFPGHEMAILILTLFVCLIMSFLVSTISYYYFESYFLRLKKVTI